MSVTRVSAHTGGGNMDVVLPGDAADLSVTAKTGGGNVTVEIGNGIKGNNLIYAGSGAGNVVVSIPGDVAARIHATTGWGKVLMDPRFSQTDKDTYQSPDFDHAANKIEITTKSGAGNVSVSSR
jgi:predicted membrane protein